MSTTVTLYGTGEQGTYGTSGKTPARIAQQSRTWSRPTVHTAKISCGSPLDRPGSFSQRKRSLKTDLGVLHDVPVNGLLVLSVDLGSLDQLVLELFDAVLQGRGWSVVVACKRTSVGRLTGLACMWTMIV